MNKKINNKESIKNIIIISSLAMLIAIGTVFSYLINANELTNTFTVGEVEITLEEPSWNEENAQSLLPKDVLAKDPKITNVGVNDAYVFMEVLIPYKHVKTAADDGTFIPSSLMELFTFDANENWSLLSHTESEEAGYSKYVFSYGNSSLLALSKNASTNPLFNEIKFVNAVEGQFEGQNLDVLVTALAIQTEEVDENNPQQVYDMLKRQCDTAL